MQLVCTGDKDSNALKIYRQIKMTTNFAYMSLGREKVEHIKEANHEKRIDLYSFMTMKLEQ